MGRVSNRKRIRREVLHDPSPGEGKLSTRLGLLIALHVDASETRDRDHLLFSLGAVAWNIAVLPRDTQAGLIGDVVREAARAGLPLTEAWLTGVVLRKAGLCPGDDRFIGNCEVREESKGRLTVTVASLRVR